MSCNKNSNGVMTRSRTKNLEAQLEVRPEDSVSNVGSRALFTSGPSVAQIEYEEQLETRCIMLDSQLARLARDKAQAQLARDKARAELKTQMALKEAALRAEFRKKELEERRSRSATAFLTSSRQSGNFKAVGIKTGRERIDVSTEIARSAPAVGEKKQHELPLINDATKAVNFRKEKNVNRGAANEAVMHNKYYNKGDTCPSFSCGLPRNDCANDLCNLQYPRGRVGVDKDQNCQRTLTEEQHEATVEPPIRTKKVTSPMLIIRNILSRRCGQVLLQSTSKGWYLWQIWDKIWSVLKKTHQKNGSVPT